MTILADPREMRWNQIKTTYCSAVWGENTVAVQYIEVIREKLCLVMHIEDWLIAGLYWLNEVFVQLSGCWACWPAPGRLTICTDKSSPSTLAFRNPCRGTFILVGIHYIWRPDGILAFIANSHLLKICP